MVEICGPEISYASASLSQPWKPGDDVISEPVYFHELPSYQQMFEQILLKNQLCIIGPQATSKWCSRLCWVTEIGTPDYDYLKRHFGKYVHVFFDQVYI